MRGLKYEWLIPTSAAASYTGCGSAPGSGSGWGPWGVACHTGGRVVSLSDLAHLGPARFVTVPFAHRCAGWYLLRRSFANTASRQDLGSMRTTAGWLLLLLRPTAAMTLPRRATLGLATAAATAPLRSGAPALASAAPSAGASDDPTALPLLRHCYSTPLLHCSYNANATIQAPATISSRRLGRS